MRVWWSGFGNIPVVSGFTRGGHAGPDDIGCSDEFCDFLFDKELNGSGAYGDFAGYGARICLMFMGSSPNSVMGMAGRLIKKHLLVDDNGILLLRYPPLSAGLR